jgi:signal peptidase II
VQQMRKYLIFLIVPVIFIADRLTKILIVQNVDYLGNIVVTPFFSIVYARNYGGAFSILSQHHLAKYIFTFLPLAIIGVLIYILLAYRFEFPKRLSLICILSGAIGNIYDRLAQGYVVDFLDFYYNGYHWPAFNVADISISFGVCLWLYAELTDWLRKAKRVRNI